MHLWSAIEIEALEEHDVSLIAHKTIEYFVEPCQHLVLALKATDVATRHVVDFFIDEHAPLADGIVESVCPSAERVAWRRLQSVV